MGFLRSLILAILSNAVALWATTEILTKDFVITGGILGFVVAGIIFGLINTLIKPLLKLVSLPLIFLSMGLMLVVINMFILWSVQYTLNTLLQIPGLDGELIALQITGGFLTYLIASAILGVINTFSHWLFTAKK